MGWKHFQTVNPRKREPQVGERLFGFRLLIPILSFQIHRTFNISYFPQFNLSFEKKYIFPKMPKNHLKITQNRQTVVNEISREI